MRSPDLRIYTKALLLLFVLAAACRTYTYQLRWPEGATAAQFKMDSDACASARPAFDDSANEMNAVGTSAADRDDTQRLWNRCMESRGYERVKAPRSQPAAGQ